MMNTESLPHTKEKVKTPSTLAYVIVQRGQEYVLFLTKVDISGQINCTDTAQGNGY